MSRGPSPTSISGDSSPGAAVRALAPRAAELAGVTERDRCLPAELVDALRAAGVFRMCVPRELGGVEGTPAELVEAVEMLARADGSTAWCAMIGATSGTLAAYLPEGEAHAVYGDPSVVTGGVVAPRGRAAREPGALRVSGQWSFVSGVGHCHWLMLGCRVDGDDGPEKLADGTPDVRLVVVPTSAVEVLDTWKVSGLRGTGSHDVRVEDLVVPVERSVSLLGQRPCRGGALFAFPIFGLLALGIAAVALGLARGAIDDLLELAGAKIPTGASRPLAQRAGVQGELARSEATLRAARALLLDAIARAWQAAGASAGEPLAVEHRLALRLAATHATRSAARVVDSMYDAGGGSSIYDSSPLQRRFRDVHAATQHMMVAPATYELAGRLLLGLPTEVSQL